MYFKSGGNILRLEGKILSRRFASLSFVVRGPSFLNWIYVPNDPTSPTTPARPNGIFMFRSKKPNRMTINYGDGTVQTYDFIAHPSGTNWGVQFRSQITSPANSGEYLPAYDNHIFTDGQTTQDRIVTITFDYPEAIYYFLTNVIIFRGRVPQDIDKFDLEILNISNTQQITDFPYNIANNKKLTSLTFSGIGPRINTFPDSFLGFPVLTDLNINGIFNFADPVASGLYKVANYGSALRTLGLSNNLIGQVETDLPPEFTAFTAIETLNIGFNLFEEVPPRVNQLTSLKQLILGGAAVDTSLTSWGNFSALVNLERLTPSTCSVLTTDIPSWFSNFTKLKFYTAPLVYRTQTRIDTFVNNFYDFIVANAAMTGANTLPFRGMFVQIYASNDPTQPNPTGTYQQPTGYIAGSSNGTPASPREKVWVLVNQYGHTWTMNPVG